MTPQFIVAGALALVGAAIHGGVGDALIVRKLSVNELPPTPFGGPKATMVMIRVTWHIVTLTFATLGSALATCGSLGSGDACRGIGVVTASSFTGFLVLAAAVALLHGQRSLFGKHLGPYVFLAVAALAWWGAL